MVLDPFLIIGIAIVVAAIIICVYKIWKNWDVPIRSPKYPKPSSVVDINYTTDEDLKDTAEEQRLKVQLNEAIEKRKKKKLQ